MLVLFLIKLLLWSWVQFLIMTLTGTFLMIKSELSCHSLLYQFKCWSTWLIHINLLNLNSMIELYWLNLQDKRLFDQHRKIQLDAVKSLQEYGDYSQRYKLVDMMIQQLFKARTSRSFIYVNVAVVWFWFIFNFMSSNLIASDSITINAYDKCYVMSISFSYNT